MRKCLLLFLSLLSCLISWGGPARRGQCTIVQPDGSMFTGKIRGDEFSSCLTDLQGHALAQDEDGWFCYAIYDESGVKRCSQWRVGSNAPAAVLAASLNIPLQVIKAAGAEKRRKTAELRSSKVYTLKIRTAEEEGLGEDDDNSCNLPSKAACIAILAQFSDVQMQYGTDYFEDLLNAGDYSYNGATGSVAEYFEEQLHGACELSFTLGPLVTLSGTQKNYGAHSGTNVDKNPQGIVSEACQLAHDGGLDFSAFDLNEDGEVDYVLVIVAGKDEADGGGDDCIWSHQWYLLDGANVDLELDGVKINSYAMSTELCANDDGEFVFRSIGSVCHEFGHCLGLSDLYDTDGVSSGGEAPALWESISLMDNGNRNNSGNTPPNFGAVELSILGVGQRKALSSGNYVLEPVNENARYLRHDSAQEGEFYLIECRSESGWDEYIGGSGLVIYHIDMSDADAGWSDTQGSNLSAAERWTLNEINCRPDHECVHVVAACSDAVDVSQVFYPCDENDAFTALTDPAFTFWDGTESELVLTGISLGEQGASFSVVNTANLEIPNVVSVSSDIYQNVAIIQWKADIEDYDGLAYVSWGQSNDEELQDLEIQSYDGETFAVRLDGLSPRTAYKLNIQFGAEGVMGKQVSADFTTKSLYSSGYPYIYLSNSDRNSSGSFPTGSALPLVVYNLSDAESISWQFNSQSISDDGSGYYHVSESGRLRAVIQYENGSMEIIQKIILVE